MLAQKDLNVPMGMSLLWVLADGPQCFVGLASFLGLTGGPVSLIFRTLSIHYIKLITFYLMKILPYF